MRSQLLALLHNAVAQLFGLQIGFFRLLRKLRDLFGLVGRQGGRLVAALLGLVLLLRGLLLVLGDLVLQAIGFLLGGLGLLGELLATAFLELLYFLEECLSLGLELLENLGVLGVLLLVVSLEADRPHPHEEVGEREQIVLLPDV